MNYKELTALKKNCKDFYHELSNRGFTFEVEGFKINTHRCLVCNAPLEIRSMKTSIDLDSRIVYFKTHGCVTNFKPKITFDRFRTVLPEADAKVAFDSYIQRKTKYWKPESCDTMSLKFHQQKYGEIEGLKKYEERKRKSNVRSLQFYIDRGHSIEKSKTLLRKRQTTFSLEKLVAKHGTDKGFELWKIRQDKWQTTLKSKPVEDQLRINASKGLSREKFVLKHGEDAWKSKCQSMLISMNDRNWIIKDKTAHSNYYSIVHLLTKLSRKHIDPRIPKYHLDHIYSIAMGFRTRILPIIIGSPVNLRWIPKEQNERKSYNCDITKDDLNDSYNKWIQTENGKRYLDDVRSLQSYLSIELDHIS